MVRYFEEERLRYDLVLGAQVCLRRPPPRWAPICSFRSLPEAPQGWP